MILQLAGQTIASDPRVAALEQQLEQMRFYDNRLLTTVWFALGIVVAISLLGWYVSYRISDREISSLRALLASEVGSSTATAAADLRREISEFNQRLGEGFANDIKQLRAEVTQLTDVFSTSTKREIDALEKRTQTTLDGAVRSIDYEKNKMQYRLYELEASDYESKGYWTNAVLCHIRRMETFLRLGWKDTATGVLQDLYRCLKDHHVSFVPTQRAEVIKALEKVPVEHTHDKEKVLELLQIIRD